LVAQDPPQRPCGRCGGTAPRSSHAPSVSTGKLMYRLPCRAASTFPASLRARNGRPLGLALADRSDHSEKPLGPAIPDRTAAAARQEAPLPPRLPSGCPAG